MKCPQCNIEAQRKGWKNRTEMPPLRVWTDNYMVCPKCGRLVETQSVCIYDAEGKLAPTSGGVQTETPAVAGTDSAGGAG